MKSYVNKILIVFLCGHLHGLQKYEFRYEIIRILEKCWHIPQKMAFSVIMLPHSTCKPFVKDQRTFHTNIDNWITLKLSYGLQFSAISPLLLLQPL